MKDRETAVRIAADIALHDFWQSLAKCFPSVQTGDMLPDQVHAFTEAARLVVSQWIENNVETEPEPQVCDKNCPTEKGRE